MATFRDLLEARMREHRARAPDLMGAEWIDGYRDGAIAAIEIAAEWFPLEVCAGSGRAAPANVKGELYKMAVDIGGDEQAEKDTPK